ncbi:alpha/beta fold hydrolase [Desulfatiferula olefinivorans]
MPSDNGKDKGLDSILHAWQGRFFMNLSPTALFLAFADWGCHYLNSPEKQVDTLRAWISETVKLTGDLWPMGADAEPCPPDPRFSDEGWQVFPFSLMHKGYLASERLFNRMTTDVSGVNHHHEQLVSFIVSQVVQALAPSNFLLTNPEILALTVERRGENLIRGSMNALEDMTRRLRKEKRAGAEAYRPGVNVAATPGKVVFKNRLIELICYTPTTKTVHAEPVLIVPAWIMKYYILDLSKENSLVRFLVENGHTVFMISWKNPGVDERDLGMADYLNLGIVAALDVISTLVPGRKIHSVGYCLGGTLLAIAVAWLAGQGKEVMQTVTLLAAQTDFTDAGELTLFIDDSQVAWLDDLMNSQDYLKTDQMAGAFRMLRANELIWSDIITNYLKGERTPVTDLMAWNADATRMPYAMHSEYLRSLFLKNDLFEGRYRVAGVPVALSNIHAPVFLVATKKDHVAPWMSVYKFLLPSDAESVTFVLTNGGHNAGIISEPGHRNRRYQMTTRREGETYLDPLTFLETAKVIEGSWWLPFQDFLAAHSGGQAAPPLLPAGLADAPGDYVRES